VEDLAQDKMSETGPKETREPGFAEIAKDFVDKIKEGGMQEKVAAEAFTDLFKVKNQIGEDQRRIEHFQTFARKLLKGKHHQGLQKIIAAGRNMSLAQVTMEMSKIYYYIEDAYVKEISTKEFQGEKPADILRKIGTEKADTRKEIRQAFQ